MNTMTMRVARGPDGELRHVPTPFVPKPVKGAKKARRVPDPIKTNGESAAEQMKLLLERKGEVPSVNQVELHPRLPQTEIRKFGRDHGIAIESWSPLGGSQSGWGKSSKPNTLLGDPVVARIAERHGKSPAQVLVRWHVQNGLIVIPKSVREARIKENIAVFDFALGESDLSELATLDDGGRLGIHPDQMNIGAPPASAS